MIRSLPFFLTVGLFTAYAQSPCERLKSLSLPDTTITAAESVAAGPYRAPAQANNANANGPAAQQPATMLPAHCRVNAILKPTSDSIIEMELWLPQDWNGKFEAVGGGGWAGNISFPAMVNALLEGYATASTDTGHKGGDGTFALNHPEKVVDFGYRAIHEMTAKSKDLVRAFYGKEARLAYFNGCSTGGRQALMEAQRYPSDFDGIIAGAPANNHILLHVAGVSRAIDIFNIPGDHTLSPAKQAFLAKSVMDACDALDGVKDGLLNNPRRCHFDVSTLLCTGADSDTCLTAPQLAAVKRMYTDTKTKKGEIVWTGYEFGGELGWNGLRNSTGPGSGGLDSIRYLGYNDPNYDWHTFDLDRDLALTVEKAGYINAGNPDLSGFKSHGGKLIMYHGWSDPAISPGNTINYYSSVLNKMGRNQDNWMRLYMVPGMQHCRGGPGPNQFSVLGALERWRENGSAPDQMIASHVSNNRVDMTRPLCPYPQVAVYKGVGSTNDAANFACRAQ
jgi:feruloyl esterase